MSDENKTGKLPSWIAEHVKLYRKDPEQGRLWDSTPVGGPGILPTLLLTTTGRKSGEPRALPLIYGEADGAYIVIGSKGGMPSHPIWFLNLEAKPECELMVGAKAVSARARIAEGEERERIWAQMAEIYPPYNDYQRFGVLFDREIPWAEKITTQTSAESEPAPDKAVGREQRRGEKQGRRRPTPKKPK